MESTKKNGYLLDKIKLKIDFSKLAGVAKKMNKKAVFSFLVSKIENKINEETKLKLLLEVGEYGEALRNAVEGGDPQNINKVFIELIKSNKNLTELAFKVEGGIRHLRNFAKKRHDQDLLRDISDFLATLQNEKDFTQSGLKQGDYSEIIEILRKADLDDAARTK